MADKFPQTSRSDVAPSKNPTASKTKGESFNTAANAPNNPKKDKQPTSWSTSNDYPGVSFCDEGDE